MAAQTFFWQIYLLLAFMAMGSWGLFIAMVVISNIMNRQFTEFRISLSAFGVIAWALFSLASYNVSVPDGSGALVRMSYPMLGYFGIAGSVAMGLFLLDSALKAFRGETQTADTDLMEQV